ncbi:C45 family autoproteolytic acyltransferase/hydolase [Gemmobacter caeruleus]|uniref:C45 family autoproteolytic acyltransferase/hydolase n=1 Tax=Gemmobacter caeruleus TaxID=2595004 RepID=UPI0011EE816F|nr:C45 family peptidase [Gemmobacter caeruleus]
MPQDRTAPGLGWLGVAGDAHQTGLALGRRGAAAVAAHLRRHPLWSQVNAPCHSARVAAMAAATQARFPRIWAEIAGLAEGLGLPLMQVFAWNCRGDLLASVPDGCTTVLLPGPEPVLAHNEDGLPCLRDACFIAEIQPEDAPALHAFCYPGSIPGHTFAFTAAGLVQTVNNLRLTGIAPGIPRMVLGRAVLGCASLTEALDLLRDAPSGGFHFGLMQRGDPRILSVEFGGGGCSVQEITRPALHANHALHLPGGLRAQIVTASSRDRQERGAALLARGADPLTILRDDGGAGLPIRRDAPDDPDEENTLATAVIRLAGPQIDWSIHDRAAGPARHRGTA